MQHKFLRFYWRVQRKGLHQPAGVDGRENQSQGWAWRHQQGKRSTQTGKNQTGELSEGNQKYPWWKHLWLSVEHQHSEQEGGEDTVEKLRQRLLCQPETCVRTENSSKI